MKTLISLSALSLMLACLTACGDAYTEIDGRSRQSFLESAADLKMALPQVQKPLFEQSLIHLQHDQEFSELDGMDVDEILEAEAERLKEVRDGRVAKLEKFQGYERQFLEQSSEVPENISMTLKEVRDYIEKLDLKLAVLDGDVVGGSNREVEVERETKLDAESAAE